MAVKIRLKRMGAKKQPYYRIVVADERTARDGKSIDLIGRYKPVGEKSIDIDAEKAKEWLNKGAKPTDTVAKLFKENGITK